MEVWMRGDCQKALKNITFSISHTMNYFIFQIVFLFKYSLILKYLNLGTFVKLIVF